MIKILSLWQPWATLMALGAKKIETRHWTTDYRGPFGIHAAKRFNRDDEAMCEDSPFVDVMIAHGLTYRDLPRGEVVGLGNLVDVERIDFERTIVPPHPLPHYAQRLAYDSRERAFGNYETGRFAWCVEDVRIIAGLPMRGYQNLWTPSREDERALWRRAGLPIPPSVAL
jgi:hypothetical protein